MHWTRIFGTAFLLVVLASSAEARVRCTEWTRLGPDGKAARISAEITGITTSNRARRYDVNHRAIARCLEGSSSRIEFAFDDACAAGQSVGVDELDRILKHYVWNCVN